MWYSVARERTVLAVARTVTTTLTLLGVLPDLFDDSRVETLFTVMPAQRDENFEWGVVRLLADAQVRIIPWEQAIGRRFDLILTASYEGFLSELSGPLFMLRHGAGIGKYISLPVDGKLPVTSDGLGSTTMVISHAAQASHYVLGEGRARTLVAGDPVLDCLRASVPAADRYKEGMGVRDGVRLVTVCSTWGENSLIAKRPELLGRLVAELPVDEFRVAGILHPNVWFGHSVWQMRTWLRDAVDGGLILAAPGGGWRGVLAASDVVVGDHGSVTLHAAALGKPVCLGVWGSGELIAGDPTAELEDALPRIDADGGLAAQVRRVVAEFDPALQAQIVAGAFECPGESHAILRRAMYELMGLSEPERLPRVLAVKRPDVMCESVTAHNVYVSWGERGELVLSRSPAVLSGKAPPPPPPTIVSHLVVAEDERDLLLHENAAIILRCGRALQGWDASTLRAFPGARMAGTVLEDGGLSVLARTGERSRLVWADPRRLNADPVLLASVLYAYEVAGKLSAEREQLLRVVVGGRELAVALLGGREPE
jgi:hypothetical protein